MSYAPNDPWSIDSDELKAITAAAPTPLIDGLLPSRAVVTFAGSPGIGKSFTALSWAACVAEGLPWFGRAVAPAQPVVYILGEGWTRFGKRVAAWEEANAHRLGPNLRFVNGAGRGVDLNDGASFLDTLANLQRIRPGLVVLDTFSMLAQINSENDNAEVARVYKRAHAIVEHTGATVVVVHHVSKEAGQVRGATAFLGNSDTVVLAKADDGPGRSGTFFLSTRSTDNGKQRDTEGIKLPGFTVGAPGVLLHESTAARAAAVEEAFEAMTDDEDDEPAPAPAVVTSAPGVVEFHG